MGDIHIKFYRHRERKKKKYMQGQAFSLVVKLLARIPMSQIGGCGFCSHL